MIYRFSDPLPLDRGAAARLLGGKGASLAHLNQLGLPVPPGFTLSTELYHQLEARGRLPEDLDERLRAALAEVEAAAGRTFGDPGRPLLLAVRSAGPSSMPGMLETVLDVGVNAQTLEGLVALGGRRFALDVRRRFLESYASVVLGVPRAAFAALIGPREVPDLEDDALAALLAEMDELIEHEAGEGIPQDPWQQLRASIDGVLASWRTPRAQKYRDAQGIPAAEGTAIVVQAMAFGNLDERSGAGVVFSRNPSTGERALFGEWLRRGQGEDVVSGRRTPLPLASAQVRRGMEDCSLEKAMPEVFAQLRPLCERLEAHFGDVVDVEITIEAGRLSVLQCRSAKRTARAAARVAVEMHAEGVSTRTQALRQVDPASLRQLLTPRLPDPETLAAQGLVPVARGLAASPGAAAGRVVLDGHQAARFGDGEDLVLVRADTSAEDVETMRSVSGVLTSAGGLTSHAAVVARAIGKPCVTGASGLHVDYGARQVVAKMGGEVLREGDMITIDGSRGLVYATAVAVEPAPASEHVERLLEWADEAREALVFAEASSARLATIGRRFGSDGVAALGASASALAFLVEAAGDGVVLARASGEAAIGAALETLRPDRDHLLVPEAELEIARRKRGDRAFPIWSEGRGVADGYFVDSLEDLAGLPEAVWVGFRADEQSRPLLDEALTGRRRVVLVVHPLDVPVGRLLAGQA
ncbi:MAG: pyruvate, phosphate dikinase [Sandaracinaceae bacterium]|nr:pyruvate, phosphate dikinase [Sandaracinaceae bacterium]